MRRKILERGGHSATLVNDGEQVLDALEREHHDAVLLDRNMPGLGGIATVQAIRLLTGGTDRLPVVMLSADVTPEAKREALEAGHRRTGRFEDASVPEAWWLVLLEGRKNFFLCARASRQKPSGDTEQ